MAAYSFNGFEMESFIGKFLYLSSHGYESNLQLTSSNGNISVNIQANLGNIISQCENIQRNIKPSRARRRRRREEFRSNTFTDVTTEETSNDEASNAILHETFCMSDTSQSDACSINPSEPLSGLSPGLTIFPRSM